VAPNHVRYIIVVHGMGEARKNETVIQVVNRFAEARGKDWPVERSEVLTLGKASGQTGKEVEGGVCRYQVPEKQFLPWLEFEGIPAAPQPPRAGEFYGEPNRNPGVSCLRFADAFWGDIVNEDMEAVGQDPVVWADALLGRLEAKDRDAGRLGTPRVPFWALEILDLIRDTVRLVHGIARVYASALDSEVFDKYLGDVQVYAEYAHARGRAVRRFHRLMNLIEKKHLEEEAKAGFDPPREARYTVVAHSLGTVMSFDALMYAHALRPARTGDQPGFANFPFPGYATQDEETSFLDTSWIDRVDSYVTMGSPIDKFLLLWWANYRYLNDVTWIDPDVEPSDERGRKRIAHFNFCEEQDPVGHNLDFVGGTVAYRKLFEKKQDQVYVRSWIPGGAHVAYWKDQDLFRWILHCSVDTLGTSPNPALQPRWFDPKVYRKVLRTTYKYVPLAAVVSCFFLITLAWVAETWHTALLATLGAWVVGTASAQLIRLLILWRQVLRLKKTGKPMPPEITFKSSLADARLWRSGRPRKFDSFDEWTRRNEGADPESFNSARDEHEVKSRSWEECRFRIWVAFFKNLWLFLTGLFLGPYVHAFLKKGLQENVGVGRAFMIGGVLIGASLIWNCWLKRKPRNREPAMNGRRRTGPWYWLRALICILVGTGSGFCVEYVWGVFEPLDGWLLSMLFFASIVAIFFTYRHAVFVAVRREMASYQTAGEGIRFEAYAGSGAQDTPGAWRR
jgi:hypothetical protein